MVQTGKVTRPLVFWLLVALGSALVVWMLSDMLLPFMIGIAIAYLLNPVCLRLQGWGVHRGFAALLVLLLFVVVAVLLISLAAPLLADQIRQLAQALPGAIESARTAIEPKLQMWMSSLSPEQVAKLREAAQQHAGEAAGALSSLAGGLWQGSQAVVDFVSILIITPVVAFYLLRDWLLLVARVDSWLPLAYAPTIRTQLAAIDKTLAGFVRGQAVVCLLLGAYYAIGLALVGVKYGVLVGLLAGFLSFIPFVGSTFGLVVATALAFFQFDTYTQTAIVAGLFMFAQFLEGNFIAPKFIGESVGLHPVWIMFALMAGGSLMGFTGLLLAVPVAAVVGVLTRFALSRYLDSRYYRGAARLRGVRPL